MSKKNSPYSVLVICEGRNTEPAYFEKLQSYINDNFGEYFSNGIIFEIFPLAPLEKKILQKQLDNELFTRQKKNKRIKHPEQIINDDVEDSFIEEPSRWVRYAQKKAVGSGYDQLWSVFDFDKRPREQIKRAFDLALKDNVEDWYKVEIGFSSYSFEFWILLHLTLELGVFSESECKNKENKSIECGTLKDEKDCRGKICLKGRISNENPEIAEKIKSDQSTFELIQDSIHLACIRASLVRFHQKETNDVYDMNPVTTLDLLIGNIIPNSPEIYWHNENSIDLGKWKLKCQKDQNSVNINLINYGSETILIQKNNLSICDKDFEITKSFHRIYSDKEEVLEIDQIPVNNEILYIRVQIENKYHFSRII